MYLAQDFKTPEVMLEQLLPFYSRKRMSELLGCSRPEICLIEQRKRKAINFRLYLKLLYLHNTRVSNNQQSSNNTLQVFEGDKGKLKVKIVKALVVTKGKKSPQLARALKVSKKENNTIEADVDDAEAP